MSNKNEYIELVKEYRDIIEKDDLKEFYIQRASGDTKKVIAVYTTLLFIAVVMDLSGINYPDNVLVGVWLLVAVIAAMVAFELLPRQQRQEFQNYLRGVRELESRKKE